jgi:hypothetical protein
VTGLGSPVPVRLMNVLPTLQCGGTEQQVMMLTRALQTDGFDMEFACLRRWGPFVEELQQRAIRLVEYDIPSFRSVRALRQHDCVLVNGTSVKDWLVGDGHDPAKIVVIPNGVDVLRFERPADAPALADAIPQLLENRALAARLACAARAFEFWCRRFLDTRATLEDLSHSKRARVTAPAVAVAGSA